MSGDASARPPSRAAFVVGPARSGTTLLRALLDGHPQTWVVPFETKVVDWHDAHDPVTALLESTRCARNLPDEDARAHFAQALREELSASAPGPAPALRACVRALARVRPPAPRAEVWIEKTPKHLRLLPALAAEFGPSTRFVAILRDPRAVLNSHVRRWDLDTPRAARRVASRWAVSDELVRRAEDSLSGLLVVRYEDLVRTPEDVMRRVAEHLDIAFDASLLSPTSGGRPWTGPLGTTGVSSASLARHEHELDHALRVVVERRLHRRMRRRGYVPSRAPGLTAALDALVRDTCLDPRRATRAGRH